MANQQLQNPIEMAYWQAIDAMTPAQKIARAEQLFHWTRGILARQITTEKGPLSAERLKWEVALRMYGNEKQARELILKRLADVPD